MYAKKSNPHECHRESSSHNGVFLFLGFYAALGLAKLAESIFEMGYWGNITATIGTIFLHLSRSFNTSVRSPELQSLP
jgi:hypothetical protein